MNEERKRLNLSFVFPALIVFLMWVVWLIEIIFHTDLSIYGLQPLHAFGLIGIFTSPFLHGGISHLFANTIPMLVLGGLLFYFYKDIAWRILLLIWLTTGLWVWVFANRDTMHIGASGIVYGLAAFLFLSGIIRRENRLMALTLLIAFLYGSLLWGIFPQFFPKERISWESHLMGLLAGFLLAIYYRKTGPQRKKYDWEDEEDEDERNENPDDPPKNEENPTDTTGNPGIRYHYRNDGSG